MVRINKVVTKTGDTGETSLYGPGRIRKDSLRIETIGCIDELIATCGMIRSLEELSLIPSGHAILAEIQNNLFDIGSELAASDGVKSPYSVSKENIGFLENHCDDLNAPLKKLNSFVLPGGSLLNSWLHLARVCTRRAERRVVKFTGESPVNPLIQIYLNRLSDLFFIMARNASHYENKKELLWEPGKTAKE